MFGVLLCHCVALLGYMAFYGENANVRRGEEYYGNCTSLCRRSKGIVKGRQFSDTDFDKMLVVYGEDRISDGASPVYAGLIIQNR